MVPCFFAPSRWNRCRTRVDRHRTDWLEISSGMRTRVRNTEFPDARAILGQRRPFLRHGVLCPQGALNSRPHRGIGGQRRLFQSGCNFGTAGRFNVAPAPLSLRTLGIRCVIVAAPRKVAYTLVRSGPSRAGQVGAPASPVALSTASRGSQAFRHRCGVFRTRVVQQ